MSRRTESAAVHTDLTFGQRLAANLFKMRAPGRVELHVSQVDLAHALDVAYEQGAKDLPPGLIVDPDYARIYTQARVVAWSYGYSCCAQGSFTRDLDLLLVPWTETATDVERIVARLCDVAGLRIAGSPSDKPHRRRSWTLLLPGNDVRWVDLSAFSAQAGGAA